MKGIVKWFNNTKGYGFIINEGKDIFVHYSQIEDNGYKYLAPGQTVEFELKIINNKPQAKHVYKLNQ